MSVGRNLLAGLANSVWSALTGLAVVPFYLKYLGIEAYGLIGFFITTQAVLNLLDMGMAPTINREVARCSASGDLKKAGGLLHTLAVFYWSMAGVIALLILALAPLIVESWLQSKQLSPQTISHAVILMGLVVACRWPIGLYQGALNGAQRLAVSSGINMAMTTITSLGAVAVLAFVSSSIEAFFIWQACLGLVYALTIRTAAWRIIGRSNQISFDIEKLKSVWRFTAGMSGIALSATVLTQLDKVILSKVLELEGFGRYMLATTVVGGLYMLIIPVFNVVYPRFSALTAAEELEKLTDLYRYGTRLFASFLFPVAMLLAVFSEELVRIWTGNETVAVSVAPVISLLSIGSALHGVMFIPYALQLACGTTRLPLTINMILMVILVPLITFLALTYGVLGGAAAWLIFQVLYVLLGTWLTHRRILKGVGISWLFTDVGIPLILTSIAGVGSQYIVQQTECSPGIKLVTAITLALMATLLSFATLPKFLKIEIFNKIGFIKKSHAVF